MKHAGEDALAALESLLKKIRRSDSLKEKTLGTFYRKSSAFLHFHEDPEGLFADMKVNGEWNRFPLNDRSEREKFLGEFKRQVTE